MGDGSGVVFPLRESFFLSRRQLPHVPAFKRMPQEQGMLFLMGKYSLNYTPLFPFLSLSVMLFITKERFHKERNPNILGTMK